MPEPIATVVDLTLAPEDIAPLRVAVDAQGRVYLVVAGVSRSRDGEIQTRPIRIGCIQLFSPQGVVISKWGTPGSGPLQFQEPRGITLDHEGNLYVVDGQNNRVQKLSPYGSLLTQVS